MEKLDFVSYGVGVEGRGDGYDGVEGTDAPEELEFYTCEFQTFLRCDRNKSSYRNRILMS